MRGEDSLRGKARCPHTTRRPPLPRHTSVSLPRHTRDRSTYPHQLLATPSPARPYPQVLLSVRRYRAAASVSPAAHITVGEEEEEEDFFSYESLLNPPQHGAEAIAPVDEPCVAGLRDGFRSLSVSE